MTNTRNRVGRAAPVASLLPQIGRKAFQRFGFAESAVVARWPEIVGTAYAAQTTPETLRFPHGRRSGGTLTLAVSGAHAVLVQHIEPQIIERVNRFFGYAAVARLAIRQTGDQTGETQRRRTPRPVPVDAGLDADVVDSLKPITDPELKARLEDLARQIAASTGPPRIG
jgi:hypothetical protein